MAIGALICLASGFVRPALPTARGAPAVRPVHPVAAAHAISMTATAQKVGIVGATGAVGKEVIGVLEKRGYPMSSVRLFGSERSAGTVVSTSLGDVSIEAFSVDAARQTDVLFLCVDGSFALEHGEKLAAPGGPLVIDNSSAFRRDPKVPLLVPEINAASGKGHRLIANPNCTTAILLMALAPLVALFGVKRVIVSTYQAASGAGAEGMAELQEGLAAGVAGKPFTNKVHPRAPSHCAAARSARCRARAARIIAAQREARLPRRDGLSATVSLPFASAPRPLTCATSVAALHTPDIGVCTPAPVQRDSAHRRLPAQRLHEGGDEGRVGDAQDPRHAGPARLMHGRAHPDAPRALRGLRDPARTRAHPRAPARTRAPPRAHERGACPCPHLPRPRARARTYACARLAAQSVTIETVRPVDLAMVREILSAAPGVRLVDDPAAKKYPMPITATGSYDVEVGRLRKNEVFGECGLDMFVCGDQLLRGAALNAVLIAEALVI